MYVRVDLTINVERDKKQSYTYNLWLERWLNLTRLDLLPTDHLEKHVALNIFFGVLSRA